ncbi:MAG: alkaline phosphatase PhoX [Sterolibacterium sp.]
MQMKTIYLAIAGSAVLAGCIGDSGSDNSPAAPELSGILSDSAVRGVAYSSSSGVSGTTAANGEFKYAAGDTVIFKIGNITLGAVNMAAAALGSQAGNKVVRPKDLAGVTDENDAKALAVAQVIQTVAAAAPSDTSIDVSFNAGKFTSATAATVDSLDKAKTVLTSAGLAPASLTNVTQHLLAAPAEVKSVEFTPTDVAGLTVAQRAVTYTTSKVKVTYSDNSTKEFPLSYVNLFNNTDTNKTADGTAAAAIRDKNGVILKDVNGKPFVAQTPDANSLMNIGGTPYLVTHFEYENNDSAGNNWYGKLPMTMTVSKLNQSTADGKFTVASIKQVDFSGVNGLWIPCAGARSPWNTHLGSEEYEPDARCEITGTLASCAGMEYTQRMAAFRTLYGIPTASPYQYGLVPEVTVAADGASSVKKWHTAGRISREKLQFFGDSRTAIQGDDGTYTSLTLFVADKTGDLSAGSLYAARWNQVSTVGTDGGRATLTWIKLGQGKHDDIKKAVDAGVKFTDLFDVDTSGTTPAGYKRIKAGHEVAMVEDLKLKTGTFGTTGVSIATLAAFLETRRYAAYLGATTEFEKFEGVAFNAKDGKAYAAMARMSNGMEDKSADAANDIRLKKNSSGAVYELTLKPSQVDSSGNAIDSEFVPVVMEALVVGEDMATDAEGNKSKLDKIASPDNLWYSERMRVLFIGEDSSNHVNNYLWAYHLDSKKLVRILSLPMGAESTGLQVVDNMNGYAYIMANYQHAGDKNSTAQATYDSIIGGINPDKAEVGYLAGVPAMR